MYNPNLMNPEIVTRLAQEREIEARVMLPGLPEVELEPGAPAVRKSSAARKDGAARKNRAMAFFARLYAMAVR